MIQGVQKMRGAPHNLGLVPVPRLPEIASNEDVPVLIETDLRPDKLPFGVCAVELLCSQSAEHADT
jgi:hypothetical protein